MTATTCEQAVPATHPRSTRGAAPKSTPERAHRGRLLWTLLGIAILVAAYDVIRYRPYTARSDFAYVLGIVGGSSMLVLLLYPLRKRLRRVPALGPMRHWFRMHMVCGVLGPLLILFHSAFRVGSINAGVAVSCMLLVAASGLVGRFLYRHVHHGLYGHRASLKELQDELDRRLGELDVRIEPLPAIKRLADDFASAVAQQPQGAWPRLRHFVALGWKRRRAVAAVRRALAAAPAAGAPRCDATALQGLQETVDATFRSMQRTRQFSRYEKLFALWHVAHVPVVYLFVLTAIVHVIAVHIY
ncbi:MAG: hypothetical protein H6977_17765 [Gammaproteobacteria bacterium]|nr:hypothetical protein [Gammaproteobacteria bacterium]